jgi:hypothetical protein
LIKEGSWEEGKLGLTGGYLAKALKCTERCVSAHVSKLIEEGVLLKEQRGLKEFDNTNSYANPLVLRNADLMKFFLCNQIAPFLWAITCNP